MPALSYLEEILLWSIKFEFKGQDEIRNVKFNNDYKHRQRKHNIHAKNHMKLKSRFNRNGGIKYKENWKLKITFWTYLLQSDFLLEIFTVNCKLYVLYKEKKGLCKTKCAKLTVPTVIGIQRVKHMTLYAINTSVALNTMNN